MAKKSEKTKVILGLAVIAGIMVLSYVLFPSNPKHKIAPQSFSQPSFSATQEDNVSKFESLTFKNMKLESPAFQNQGNIPSKYTCDGGNVNPPLQISGVPEESKSLALIISDPDAPAGVWTHWLVWNISPETSLIEENNLPEGAVEGLNDFGNHSYGGPCPPSGTHRYFFELYALDSELELDSNSRKVDVEQAMQGHIIGAVQLIGLYTRQK